MIVLDTGPLIAAADRDDADHQTCAALLEIRRRELVLPTSVLVEACMFLERRVGQNAAATLLESVSSRDLRLQELELEDYRRAAEIVRQYADLPLGFVDASVVAIAERLGIVELATLDHRDFRTVRPRHVDTFTLVP